MASNPGDNNDGQSPAPRPPSKPGASVELLAPWGDRHRQSINSNNADNLSSDSLGIFVEQRSRVHALYIREQARNKRIGLFLAFALILVAALVVVFAPEGRQTMSYWVGAALVIFAAGASGFGRIWGKTKNMSFGADQDSRALDR